MDLDEDECFSEWSRVEEGAFHNEFLWKMGLSKINSGGRGCLSQGV